MRHRSNGSGGIKCHCIEVKWRGPDSSCRHDPLQGLGTWRHLNSVLKESSAVKWGPIFGGSYPPNTKRSDQPGFFGINSWWYCETCQLHKAALCWHTNWRFTIRSSIVDYLWVHPFISSILASMMPQQFRILKFELYARLTYHLQLYNFVMVMVRADDATMCIALSSPLRVPPLHGSPPWRANNLNIFENSH